ncbi:MAG: hypothetical protein A2451_14415 [Bdellovibrionales bacterium RIFOXYC2_FULL_39_8]|nr:MAG: hypothetical protein A2451_14415 [Bdellovibrionales bacterium RIFOXYC2_FULL_39_8]
MITKLDGIIISKYPYRERDLIVRLLLRNGKKASVIFYGGKGGGSKKKSSILELGFLVEVELQKSREDSEIFTAKEWVLKWHHDNIRNNYQAYCLLCFFSEISERLALEAQFKNYESEISSSDKEAGPFRVLSNALVYLEKSLSAREQNALFLPYGQILIFITKLAVEMGVFPASDTCTLCGGDLEAIGPKILSAEHGGYQCGRCTDIGQDSGDEAIYQAMMRIARTPYQAILPLPLGAVDLSMAKKVLHYVCYQFNIIPETLKTMRAVLAN